MVQARADMATGVIAVQLRPSGDTVSRMVWSIRQSAAELSAADAKQAEYHRQLLSGLRAEAETALARKYIELQQVQDFAPLTRVSDVRQMIRALVKRPGLAGGSDYWISTSGWSVRGESSNVASNSVGGTSPR